MSRFLTTAILSFILYLVLTTATGSAGIWNPIELSIGVGIALLVAALTRPLVSDNWPRLLSPQRWFLFLIYLAGPFFWALTKANFDVVYRVITGRIRPGIVRMATGLSNDASMTLLANSITLTPGTLSVEVDTKTRDLYVHWIHVDEQALKQLPRECSLICGPFPQWARRIAE
ncbi:MAG TPA: cation:proton antiporter [Dehalococcoidia bacterium]|nr:cation:proton antiporter [Dehalococcoidia bacterium]